VRTDGADAAEAMAAVLALIGNRFGED
jgi:phosphotransferase system HPr-like phosphotransfer protein